MKRMSLLLVAIAAAISGCNQPTQTVADKPGVTPRQAEAVRAWGLANGWTEVVPDAPDTDRYTPSADDVARGWFAFVPGRNRLHHVDTMPGAAIVQRPLSAVTFPGQFEGLPVAVHSLRDLDAVHLEVTDLLGPKGGVIRAGEIQLRDVIYAPLSLRNRQQKENRFTMHPMWLVDHQAEPLSAGRGRLFWLTIPVPASAGPGRWTGHVVLRVGEVVQRREIQLDVQPFALARGLCHWCPVTAGNGFDLALYRQMVEHHCTGLSWWWGHWGLTVTREGDRASFDPGELDLLDSVTKAAGMDGPWILMLGNMVRGHLERRLGGYLPRRQIAPLFPVKLVAKPRGKNDPAFARSPDPAVGDLDDPEITRRYMEVLGALADRAKDRGYAKIVIVPYDEPTKYLKRWNAHWSDLIRERLPFFQVLNTPQGVVDWAKGLMPHSDLMVVRGHGDKIYDLAVEAGKGLVGYGRITADQSFAAARYRMGLNFATQQPRTMFFWSLNWGTTDPAAPFNDLIQGDSAARHRFAWPPTSPGQPWVESVAWEAQREGAKDYLVLLMLEERLAEVKSPRADAIRKELADLKTAAAAGEGDADEHRARLAGWLSELQ